MPGVWGGGGGVASGGGSGGWRELRLHRDQGTHKRCTSPEIAATTR